MAVRSKRLWGPTTVSTSAVTLYTCPAGETAIIKQVSHFNTGVVQQAVSLGINGTGNGQLVVVMSTAATSTTNLLEQFIVLHPGDTLRAIANAGNATVTGYGAELEGVAD